MEAWGVGVGVGGCVGILQMPPMLEKVRPVNFGGGDINTCAKKVAHCYFNRLCSQTIVNMSGKQPSIGRSFITKRKKPLFCCKE